MSPVSLVSSELMHTHTITLTLTANNEHPPITLSAFFVLLGMAIYTGVTVNFLGRRFGDWRFSWSYILGWVAMLMTFFAGEKGQQVSFAQTLTPVMAQQQH